MSVFVIAEPGCVHEGQLERMLKLIDAAHAAGANAFKNQYLGDPEKVRGRRSAKGQYPSYDWLSYPLEWHAICAEKCHALGMQYGCSTNLADDVAKVNPYVDFHKRPSFENNDTEWVDAVEDTGRLFMVSAGMLDHDGLCRLISETGPMGRVLHCTSSYPTPLAELNLGVIRAYGLHGLSDHSRVISVGGAAVMAGARVVEAHICLEDTPSTNPDFAAAFWPESFWAYVYGIREAETMLGDGRKKVEPAEAAMLKYKVSA